jgi:hypothetical protein
VCSLPDCAWEEPDNDVAKALFLLGKKRVKPCSAPLSSSYCKERRCALSLQRKYSATGCSNARKGGCTGCLHCAALRRLTTDEREVPCKRPAQESEDACGAAVVVRNWSSNPHPVIVV